MIKPQSKPPSIRMLLLVAALAALPACAGRNRVGSTPDAPLGRVIIYRNGVAYFERRAVVDEHLSLRVPRARVDDFLKSLTVTDVKTGKPLPISYPTTRADTGSWVDMTIELPPGRREVRIAYVTESPAWKPSYRVILGKDDGTARLQSWAIVDNVSGERWDAVKVGVGSTSALSFRYDLHSVQMVERETLDTGTRLAQAPPTGGSPYAVDGSKVRVLANLSTDELTAPPASAGISLAGTTGAESKYTVEGASVSDPSFGRVSPPLRTGGIHDQAVVATANRDFWHGRKQEAKRAEQAEREQAEQEQRPPPSGLEVLHAELRDSDMRIRIEGHALEGEDDPQQAALRRANTLRERLVAEGIDGARIEVAADEHPVQSPDQVVKVVAIDQPPAFTQAVVDDGDPEQPRGTAHFVADKPMSLEPGHSAMVTLFDRETEARRIYLYDPLSARGSQRYAFNAVRVVNPSDNTLESGPLTVYAQGRFLGEGLAETVPPHEAALVPYALDRTVVVEPTVETHEQVERLVTIERGVATTQTRRIRQTTLTIDNRGQARARLFVRHHVPSGWSLQEPPDGLEHLGSDLLVPVSIDPGARQVLTLRESMPVTTTLDLRADGGLRQIAAYLEAQEVAAPLRDRLRAVVDAYRALGTVDDKLSSRHEQMAVLRARVNELSLQLMGLRKVRRAQELSGHLARRMKQLGDKLDTLTVEVTELETDRLRARIELQNLVAELELRPDGTTTGGTARAAP